MPESRDLFVRRAFPVAISTGDGERQDRALEMIDLTRQLTTLAAIIAALARFERRSDGRRGERQNQAETDENGEAGLQALEAKLHTGYIGDGISDL